MTLILACISQKNDVVYYWLISGFVGWAIMIVHRIKTEGRPKGIRPIYFLNGFMSSLLMGPFAIACGGLMITNQWENFLNKLDKALFKK